MCVCVCVCVCVCKVRTGLGVQLPRLSPGCTSLPAAKSSPAQTQLLLVKESTSTWGGC